MTVLTAEPLVMFEPFLRAWLEVLPCEVTGYLNIRQGLLQPKSIQELPHRWVSTAEERAESVVSTFSDVG